MDTIPQDTPLKQCTGECKRWLPATKQYFNARKQGLTTWCKQCFSAYNKARRQNNYEEISKRGRESSRKYFNTENGNARIQEYRLSHAEEYREYNHNYKRPDEATERHRQQNRQYQKDHAEEMREYKRQYNIDHASEISERKRCYHAAYPERARVNGYNRLARKKGAQGRYTVTDIQMQYERQKGCCYWCHKKLIKYHIDHVVPLSRGGSNDPSNLVIACPYCNLSKNNKFPHEWPEGGRLL